MSIGGRSFFDPGNRILDPLGLFGGDPPKPPPPPTPPKILTEPTLDINSEEVVKASTEAKDTELKKKGRGSTILTGPRGLPNTVSGSSLLAQKKKDDKEEFSFINQPVLRNRA